ncbi:MAG: OmpH family outer membrane protein [Anaeromyxobacteraceae bacterium]
MRNASVLASLLVAGMLAPSVVRAAELKIGYVDLQRAVSEVEEGKAARAQLKREFDEKQKKLDAKEAELKRLQSDLEKQAIVLSEQAKKAKADELERKFGEAQALLRQLQQELGGRERELMSSLFDKMGQIVKEIAVAEGFTFVLEKNQSGLMYAPASLDVTNELVRKYNARFGAKSAPKK